MSYGAEKGRELTTNVGSRELREIRNVLIVTALEHEFQAITTRMQANGVSIGPYNGATERRKALKVHIVCSGIGSVAAAAATATSLSLLGPFDLVLSAGIAGGFGSSGLRTGEVIVADEVIDAEYVLPAIVRSDPHLSTFSWPASSFVPESSMVELAESSIGARRGGIVTVPILTVTRERAESLSRCFPKAIAEAMEGSGVASVAATWNTGFGELRSISNSVGKLDASKWEVETALESLVQAVERLLSALSDGATAD